MINNNAVAKANIFISHSDKDNVFCAHLKDSFQEYGYNVWLDDERIKTADYIYNSIGEGLEEANFVCVVVSPDAASSTGVMMELNIALDLERSRKCLVIPILYKGEMITLLKGRRYIDFRDPDSFDSKLAILINHIEENLRKRTEFLHFAMDRHVQEYRGIENKINNFEDSIKRRNAIILLIKGSLRRENAHIPVLLIVNDPVWECYLFPYYCPELEFSQNISSVSVDNIVKSWLGIEKNNIETHTDESWSLDSEKYSEDTKKIELYRFHFYSIRLIGDYDHLRRRRFELGGVQFQWVSLSELMSDAKSMSKNRDVILFISRRFGRTLVQIPDSLVDEIIDN